MRAPPPALLLAALLWTPPAMALDWWVQDEPERQALDAALAELWPIGEVDLRSGEPPAEGDAVWLEQDTLVLRLDGATRRAEQVGDPATQVVLVRSWLEASPGLPPPPPPPPPPRYGPGTWAPHQLHAPHLLPGAGGSVGAELSVGAAATGSLDTDPLEGAAKGYAPVVSGAAAIGRVRANATVWNIWEPERSHGPMGVAGFSVLVVDRDRWRIAPWLGAGGGWKQTDPTGSEPPATAYSAATGRGIAGAVGAGLAVEFCGDRLAWDLSLPVAGWMSWMSVPPWTTLANCDPRQMPSTGLSVASHCRSSSLSNSQRGDGILLIVGVASSP